jgi:hypothetical protein
MSGFTASFARLYRAGVLEGSKVPLFCVRQDLLRQSQDVLA